MRKIKYLVLAAILLVLLFPLMAQAEEKTYTLDEFVPSIDPVREYFETLEMLAKCVEAEAGNQGLEGKRLVVDVILNRTKDPDFPDTIREVMAQENQFSVYWNGAMEAAEPTEETWTAIKMELKEISYPGVLYFSNGDYLPYGTPWKQVGDHYFNTK